MNFFNGYFSKISTEHFSINLNQKPKSSVQKINTRECPIELHIYQSQDKFHQFAIVYSDYPQHVIDANFSEKMLDGARDGAVKNVHGELLSEILFDFSGSQAEGRELHIKVNPKVVLRTRLILVDCRLYQLQVVTAPQYVFDKKVSKFFESFKLKK